MSKSFAMIGGLEVVRSTIKTTHFIREILAVLL